MIILSTTHLLQSAVVGPNQTMFVKKKKKNNSSDSVTVHVLNLHQTHQIQTSSSVTLLIFWKNKLIFWQKKLS